MISLYMYVSKRVGSMDAKDIMAMAIIRTRKRMSEKWKEIPSSSHGSVNRCIFATLGSYVLDG